MSADARAQLEAGLRELRIHNAVAVAAKLIDFGALILNENARTNLTGARNLESLVGHLLDSLAPLALISLKDPVVDLGSGAGLPGIPIAIVHPSRRIVLLEPRAKRAAFLDAAVIQLGLRNASVLKSTALGPRAEALVGRAGTVLIRAVAQPAEALRLGLPLLMQGGTLLLYEGRLSKPTSEQQAVAARLGAGTIRVTPIKVPRLSAVRHAWLMTKKIAPQRGSVHG